jgi:hypothetical protein
MSLYVIVSGGEVSYSTNDREDCLLESRLSFDQHITDFLRHQLPMRLSEEDIRRVDLKVYELEDETLEIRLPFQEWLDDRYEENRKYEKDEAEREYKRYLELHEKYEARRLQEEKSKE